MLSEFHRRGQLSEEMNATFIVLIPKNPNLVDLRDYRPISLVSGSYKLLSKILANRLKVVLSHIMGPSQGAFVGNRQILNGVLIANELIDSRKKSHKEGVMFKIDMEEAYDHVEGDFVDYMLCKFGFGNLWRGWIRECISSTSFSVLVNGFPTLLFKASRGLRQGDYGRSSRVIA